MIEELKEELPAREFVGILHDHVLETLRKCLDKLQAPEPVKFLVDRLNELTYYLEHPESPVEKWGPEHFDLQTMVTKAINSIAEVGGTFGVPDGDSTTPRKGTFLA
jgi:hypothetical protein